MTFYRFRCSTVLLAFLLLLCCASLSCAGLRELPAEGAEKPGRLVLPVVTGQADASIPTADVVTDRMPDFGYEARVILTDRRLDGEGSRRIPSRLAERHISDLCLVVRSRRVMMVSAEELVREGSVRDPAVVLQTVDAGRIGTSTSFAIRVRAHDPKEAELAADTVARSFLERYAELEAGGEAFLEIVDPAQAKAVGTSSAECIRGIFRPAGMMWWIGRIALVCLLAGGGLGMVMGRKGRRRTLLVSATACGVFFIASAGTVMYLRALPEPGFVGYATMLYGPIPALLQVGEDAASEQRISELIELAQSKAVMDRTADLCRQLGIRDPAEVLETLEVMRVEGSDAVTLKVESPEEHYCKAVPDALAHVLIREYAGSKAVKTNGDPVVVLDSAATAPKDSYGRLNGKLAVAGAAALAAAVGLAVGYPIGRLRTRKPKPA